ncbi:MAG: hypothetical protein ABJB49_10245, partial [Nitrospirota bacterium]
MPPRPLLGCVFLVVLLAGCAVIVREAKQDLIRVRAAGSTEEIAITLNKTFVEAYKNRVTIDAAVTVDKADAKP